MWRRCQSGQSYLLDFSALAMLDAPSVTTMRRRCRKALLGDEPRQYCSNQGLARPAVARSVTWSQVRPWHLRAMYCCPDLTSRMLQASVCKTFFLGGPSMILMRSSTPSSQGKPHAGYSMRSPATGSMPSSTYCDECNKNSAESYDA